MIEEFNDLKEEFERIKNIGWVKERIKAKGSCGITFERLLKKNDDDFPLPDYKNIEIKVMNDNTKTNLHLFNLTPDGDYLFPIERLLFNLGCPDKSDKNIKKFYRTFNANDYTKMIYGNKGIIHVNYSASKVELLVYNYKNEDVNIGISWSFAYLKERLELKLGYLAFVRVSSCIICGKEYYHYHTLSLYKLKDFDEFIKLIEKGIIDITFKIGVHRDDKKYGKTYDHGTDFSIKVSDLELLYDILDKV